MENRPNVPLESSTSMCYVTGKSLYNCNPQMLCCASQICPVFSPSSSLKSWCALLVTLSAAFWCIAPPLVTLRAMALWNTWRKTLLPERSQSSWGSSLAHGCCTSTGQKLDPLHFHFCTQNVFVWIVCPKICWQRKTYATRSLTHMHQSFAR